MINEMNRRAEKYQQIHRRRSIWLRFVSILSAITVFFTTYALILPAITMEPSPGIKLRHDFIYENEELQIKFYVNGRAVFEDEKKVHGYLSADKVKLDVEFLDESNPVYSEYAEYAYDYIEEDDLLNLLAVKLLFTYEGEVLDTSLCKIEAEVTAKEKLFGKTGNSNSPYVIQSSGGNSGLSQNDDSVLALSAIQGVGSDLSQQDTGFQNDGESTISVATTVTGNTMAFAVYSTINPVFTVQYYSHITVFDDSGDVAIEVIDTPNGTLPTNGTKPATVPAYLNHIGNGQYVMAMHQELHALYSSKTYEYVKAPGVAYVNRLLNNGNYELSAVWVLKEGSPASSTDQNDWTVYPATVSFTNRAASAGPNRIYITDGTVIRLIFNEQNGSYTNAADFYDYDITDGDIHNSNGKTYPTSSQTTGKWYAQTYKKGINSFKVASGTAAFAFGNVNTATGYGEILWNGNKLNMYNSNGEKGCTFGLVTGINDDGSLIFANGITAPQIFGDKVVAGKTKLEGYSLQFNRSGDTYVLTAVNGTSAKGLNTFNNPSYYDVNGTFIKHSHIFTNNFWPMDSAWTFGADGHDLVFGSAKLVANRRYFETASNLNGGNTFPLGDDGLDHNSYFGMFYELEFELSEDYLGALEYIFYGDDDMWVFLDGKLICDIGGVHSSVGQYVDLWDHINKMPDSEKYGKHTLSFYYTERGASGSTCYMQFTLPSVSVDTQQVETNTLELGKQVINSTTDQTFLFDVELMDSNGNPLLDDYSYTIYDGEGVVLENAIINSESKTVALAHGHKLQINYLPDGVRYTVTEHAVDGFHPAYSINGSVSTEGYTASGSVQSDVHILFINSTSVILPSTGGEGLLIFGLPLLAAAMFLVCMPLIFRAADAWKGRKKT